jgi:hypothetical protein
VANTKRPQNPRITTHVVEFQFPRISGEPDFKFKSEGEWSVTAYLDPKVDADRALLSQLKKASTEAIAKEKAALVAAGKPGAAAALQEVLPYKQMLDGPHAGKFKIKASQKFRITAKQGPNKGKTFEITPPIYDNAGKLMPKTVEVWSGTTGKLCIELSSWANPKNEGGVSLKLAATQIINLRTRGQGGDPSGFGFGVEEGNAAGMMEFDPEAEAPEAGANEFAAPSEDAPVAAEAPAAAPTPAAGNSEYDF